MPKLLSNYDSEYHFLFSSALTVLDQEEDISEQLYLSPNVVRKLLDTFLAFRAPGTHSLRQKLDQVIKQTDKEIDKNRIYGLERFAQTESHADSFDDLTQLSPIVLEEAKKAVGSLFDLMEATDPEHFELMKKQCK